MYFTFVWERASGSKWKNLTSSLEPGGNDAGILLVASCFWHNKPRLFLFIPKMRLTPNTTTLTSVADQRSIRTLPGSASRASPQLHKNPRHESVKEKAHLSPRNPTKSERRAAEGNEHRTSIDYSLWKSARCHPPLILDLANAQLLSAPAETHARQQKKRGKHSPIGIPVSRRQEPASPSWCNLRLIGNIFGIRK